MKIELMAGFYFYFPNFNGRRKAVVKHDIHHLLAEYGTTICGESEISAWEIASGCKDYWAAFLINTSGVMLGFLYFPKVLTAFSRGRKTKNLYHDKFTIDQVFDMKIGDLRRSLSLDINPKNIKPTFVDFVLFLIFLSFGTVYSIFSLIFLPFIILYTIYIKLRTKP